MGQRNADPAETSRLIPSKAQRLCTFFGTAKAVPFQNGIDATSSSIHAPLSARLKRLRKNSPSARNIRKPSLGG
jgi:hypothetical protein